MMITITNAAKTGHDESVLWKFDVDFKSVNNSKYGIKYEIKRGVLCARKNQENGIVMYIE